MKSKLLNALTAALLFLMPNMTFAQAPTLGTAANFVLFTTNGAMTCSGTKYLTHLTGNVGSNLPGSITGFGNVDGVMHVFDPATGVCAADVVSLYSQLGSAIPTGTLASPFGNGAILTPGVYSIPTAATLNLDLTLDAVGDPNAVFIFQINGVLSTNASAKVKLINGALACNVFWQVGGAVNVGTGTFMRGTIVANGQIDLTSTLDTLEGRALAMNAPVLVSQLVAYTPIGCGSLYLTGPAAPILASTAAYGVFSSIGAVTSTPVTYVIGDVGGNSNAPTGFNPLNVTGTIHAMDPSTTAAAADLTNIYNYLVAMPADINLLDPADLGHGLVLTPHSYQITGITQLTGNLILNARGNPNAVFVIKINGGFTTGALSRIMLINGTQAKNVYWKVDGAVNVFSNSNFNGTLVVAGAITLNTGDTLNGRALTINGAIDINGSYVNITPAPCVASPITGVTEICEGATTILSNVDTGGVWSSSDLAVATIGSVSGIVTGVAAGTSIIKFVSGLACETTDTVTVKQSPALIAGANSVCTGSSTTLTNTSVGGTWTSSNTLIATVGSASGIVSGITTGAANITYTILSGCSSVKTITVNPSPNAGTITGTATVCPGNATTLSNATSGGAWTSTNTAVATIGSSTGIVTGVSTGTSTISYTITNGCGTTAATTIVTVSATPNAGTITGTATVCPGNTSTLSNATSGGIWTSTNTAVATIGSSTGIVTGVSTGTSTISYTITNGCGTAAATTIVTVSATPNAGTITGTATVCPGNTTTLSNATSGGIWTSVNIAVATIGSSTGIITAVATGTTTISYTVTNGCGTAAATRVATVSPLPNAGTISGAAAVCPGSSITLTNSVSGGTWSSSNANATVSAGGVVTGVTAGSNTISYTVTNSCGTTVTTKPLTISPLPNAGSISGASVVCAGSSITLTNSVSGGTWSNSNANATVSAGGVVTGVTAGANTISYTVTNSCGTTVTTKPLTISPLPNAGSIFGASVVCAGSSITLTNSVSGGTWSSSNANATVSAGGVVTGVTAGANTITYTVTNSCGTAITTQPLTISPLPNAGNIIGASSVCVGSSITLSGVVAGGSWSSSNANATVFGGVVTGVAAGTNMISYAVTNSCGTDVTTKTITVNPLPNAGSISGASGVCLGAAILLTNAITGGTWSSSNNAIATVSDGIVTGVASGTITISYAVTNMCGTDIAIKAITTNLLPLVPVISTQSPLTVCVGTMYQNFGAATQPPVNVTYKWTAVKAAIWAQGATHQYALVNFNTTGIAYVTLNAVATGTACANKSTIAINVGTNAAHIAEVSYFNSHFVCTPASEDSYQWGYDNAVTLDSTILNGEINQDYLNTSPDFFNKHYWVMTRLGDCLQKTYYHTPTAIQNIDNANSITVYPNPASDIVNIVISSSVHSNVQINVLNMLGQTITTAETTNGTVTIGIASLPVGSYLVACYQNGIKIATSRFIKN